MALAEDLAAIDKWAKENPLPSLSPWQPIETAPKDGKWFLGWSESIFRGGFISKVKWDRDEHAKKPRPLWIYAESWIGRHHARIHQPTHWMPLPAPPKEPAHV